MGGTSRRAMPDRQTEEEAVQIEHELKILRTRHALMIRWGRVKSVLFALALRVSAIVVAATLVFTLGAVIGIGVFIIGICAIAAGAIWLARGTAPRRELDRTGVPASRLRSKAWYIPNQKSKAETIEDMTALLKKRLAELKRASRR